MGKGSTTKDSILDAAEALFSEHGIEGVSLRSLTRRAGVNLAAVHYHFGSKEEVVKAVFLRRVRPLNSERIELLDRAERRGAPRLEDILTALFAPAIRLAADPDHGRRFMRLGARFYSEPAKYLASVFESEFSEVIRRFDSALHRALPALPRQALRNRTHFAIGVMVHTMLNSDRLRNWTGCACGPANAERTLDAMVRFVSAGMRSPEPPDAALAREPADRECHQ